jgi:hypothetical protein|tara:strand:- start:3445 stop:3900 length:456 start_codon:yes stop_codon:yes gene_type:complete
MDEFFAAVEFWHWWVLAAILIGIEIFAPSAVLIWPGIAAGVVGFVVLADADIAWELQLALFAVISVASLFGWRYYARSRPTATEDPELNLGGERHVGRILTLDEPIVDNRGRLMIDGVIWKIEGDNLEAGTPVKIVGAEGVVLAVEADLEA